MAIEKLREHVLANRQSIAYALGGFSTGVLGTLFGMFNVMFFTRVVGLDNSFFYTGHIVYGIWNAVNDPAFGWLIDHTANKANRRLPVIKYGGPLWCFFFMLTWYPWSSDGSSYTAFFHFLFSMFCYDGFLTYVLLVKCALLADLCVDSKDRNSLNNYSAWFSLAGSSLAMTSYYAWDEHNLSPFRTVAWVFSMLAAVGWYYSGSMMIMPTEHFQSDRVIPNSKETEHLINEKNKEKDTCGSNFMEFKKWLKFARQLLNQRSFIAYVSMNWMMNFNVTLSRSFFIFLDKEVMKPQMSWSYYLVITTLCLYLPKFGIQIMTPFANKWGMYKFIKHVNEALILVNLLALFVGFSNEKLWGILVIAQMVLFSSWGFYDLIMADVIDEDRVKWEREESVSTSVHGVQALIVKPSQSLAPMLGVWLLSKHGLHDTGSNAKTSHSRQLQHAIYSLMFGIPLVCTLCQYFIWRQYDLRGEKLKKIKSTLKGWNDTNT